MCAGELRKSGIHTIVIGIGDGTDQVELDEMAGGVGKAFSAHTFDELIAEEFVDKLTIETCHEGETASEEEFGTL